LSQQGPGRWWHSSVAPSTTPSGCLWPGAVDTNGPRPARCLCLHIIIKSGSLPIGRSSGRQVQKPSTLASFLLDMRYKCGVKPADFGVPVTIDGSEYLLRQAHRSGETSGSMTLMSIWFHRPICQASPHPVRLSSLPAESLGGRVGPQDIRGRWISVCPAVIGRVLPVILAPSPPPDGYYAGHERVSA